MDDNLIQYIDHLQRLDLKVGDVLVVQIKGKASDDTMKRVKNQLADQLKDTNLNGVKILLTDSEIQLGAMRREDCQHG